jgi:hypothetical protein
MKPLPLLKYYSRNRKRLLLLVLPVLLCTMVFYLVQVLIACYLSVEYRASVETRKSYTSIQARAKPIDLTVIEEIRQNEHTEKIVPCILEYTEMASILDSIGVRVYLLRSGDLGELMARMDLRLTAGRLPEAGRQEIVLHADTAANKGLKIGDQFGNDLDPAEKLMGLYTLTGLIDGPALCGFASLEAWQDRVGIDAPQEYGVLIYAKPGQLAALNTSIQYLPLTGNEISSLSTSMNGLDEAKNRIGIILNVVYLSLLLIIALCVGFLTYLFYLNRSREFAILNIIGYTRRAILTMNLQEISAINLATATLALGLALLISLGLNAAVFKPIGIPLPLFDPQTLLLCLCVPMVSVIAEILAVTRAFNGMEAITLLEQEN